MSVSENREHTGQVKEPSCGQGRAKGQGRTGRRNRGPRIKSLRPKYPSCFFCLEFAINKAALGEKDKTKHDNYNNSHHGLNTCYNPLSKSFCIKCFPGFISPNLPFNPLKQVQLFSTFKQTGNGLSRAKSLSSSHG